MEFEDIQAQWAEAKQDNMYTINHENLMRQIERKQRREERLSDRVEKLIIGVNLFLAVGLTALAIIEGKQSAMEYSFPLLMFLMAGYVIYVRMQRLRIAGTFDQSIAGSLDQAIADATHRTRISSMGLWYVLIGAVVVIGQFMLKDKPEWQIALLGGLFVIALIAGRWEHRRFHAGRKQELERLRDSLYDQE